MIITAWDRFRLMKPGFSGNRTSASAQAMSSLSSPARSGPNRMPARRSRPHTSRSSAAAPRAVSTGLTMWRGRGQVANTRCRSATASATVSCTVQLSRIRSAPEALRHAFSCGQPSRGATRRRSNSPPLPIARATAPILSASCGRTSTTTGLLPIGARSAPPSRPVMARAAGAGTRWCRRPCGPPASRPAPAAPVSAGRLP